MGVCRQARRTTFLRIACEFACTAQGAASIACRSKSPESAKPSAGVTRVSMAMYVLFRGKLPNKRELSRAMAELGFPFAILPGSLERQEGYMPMRLWREESGVEFDVENGRETIEEIAKGIDPRFDRIANFHWSSSDDEMLAAMCGSAALAKLVDGIVVEDQELKRFSPDEAAAFAREHLKSCLKPGETTWRKTRPADFRRYLKPLLRQRSDLVLRGRELFVQPVRHVLRGALLDRTGDRYDFRIQPYLKPLWLGAEEHCFRGNLHPRLWSVWRPDFEPLMIDVLGCDVFAPLGQLTSFTDLAAALPTSLRVSAFVLAGERERAEECLRRVESDDCARGADWRQWVQEQRDLLSRDVQDVCAEYHARESRTVKALKLDSIWQPSPFPVELPSAERERQTGEPPFAIEPWLPRPHGLLAGVPEAPDDVRFAKTQLRRDGNPILVAALAHEQAAERHRNREHYVLAARLPNGQLLLLNRGGHDRNDPFRMYLGPAYADGPEGFDLELYGANFGLHASFSENKAGRTWLQDLKVGEIATNQKIWSWSPFLGKETIWDYRGGTKEVFQKDLTDDTFNQWSFPSPGFGSFGPFVEAALHRLRTAGFGELT